MARTLVDGRHEAARDLAERELELPDPIDPQPPTLADLLHRDVHHLVLTYLPNWMSGVLGPTRRDTPIDVPTVHQLKPMIMACHGGHNGGHDPSSAWRCIFGTHGEQAQNLIRSIWQQVRATRTPPLEQHDRLASLLAQHLIRIFAEAAEQQQACLAKRAERQGPKMRAQAAAQLLEVLPSFRTALVAWCEASRDAAGAPFADVAQALPRLRARLEQELS